MVDGRRHGDAIDAGGSAETASPSITGPEGEPTDLRPSTRRPSHRAHTALEPLITTSLTALRLVDPLQEVTAGGPNTVVLIRFGLENRYVRSRRDGPIESHSESHASFTFLGQTIVRVVCRSV